MRCCDSSTDFLDTLKGSREEERGRERASSADEGRSSTVHAVHDDEGRAGSERNA